MGFLRRSGGFRLPWQQGSADSEAEQREREALQAHIQSVRQAEAARQADDLRLLASGGIPTMARQRLAILGGTEPEARIFTSDLTPSEAGLLRRNGYRPLGMVSGSAMYHVGISYASSTHDCEVAVLSEAYNTATRLAVQRMEQEAATLGAHGVIGVRYEIARREWSEKSIEVQLIGTAIAGPGAPPQTPWLSDLPGGEWWALHRAGYDPVALVYGHCIWFVLTTQDDESAERSSTNQELQHMSGALGECRTRAMQHVWTVARRASASGVVGVHLNRRLVKTQLTGRGSNPAFRRVHHDLTLSVIGTAVRLRADAPTHVQASTMALSLLDGRLGPRRIKMTAATFK